MSDIICINDTFTADQMMFFIEKGVKTPEKDKMYTVRDIIKASGNSSTGILLNEIVNPLTLVKHPILGQAMLEVNWNISRFSNLQEEVLTKEMINSIKEKV